MRHLDRLKENAFLLNLALTSLGIAVLFNLSDFGWYGLEFFLPAYVGAVLATKHPIEAFGLMMVVHIPVGGLASAFLIPLVKLVMK